MAHLFADVECYRGLFYVAFKRYEDGKRLGFELSDRTDSFDTEHIRRLMRRNTVVTFHGMTYDVPLIQLALEGASTSELKEASDRIIKEGLKWWQTQRELGIRIPQIDHIDLIEPNPAVRQGLKVLNGRLHGKRLQDLPYHPDIELTSDQMDDVIDYCLHSDLDATENLFTALKEPLELRVVLGRQYGEDFRSKSDAQIGEAIIKKGVMDITGKRDLKRVELDKREFQYDVPEWMKFETPQLQNVLKLVAETTFKVKANGKVDFPKAFEALKISIGQSVYQMGIGGLHSTEAGRAIVPHGGMALIDADVASQYPSIIMKLGLYPKALGPAFLAVYDDLKRQRLEAKKAGDKVRDKAGKIALNGAYGKLGSPYSVLYAPHLMIAVTLTGQLSLLMLIERAEREGISVVSGNTDGVLFHCDREAAGGIKDSRLLAGRLKDVTDWWESVTGFDLEFAEYKCIFNHSVNSYIAIKSDGKVKRKGVLGNPCSSRSEERDLRSQMMKNPQMSIVSDAVLALIENGTPVSQTIRESKDIRGFVTVINAAGGATWRDEYLGKVVRYYWAQDGDPIIKVKPHPSTGNRPKVPKTDGSRPLMTLTDTLPHDLDYERYIQEANDALEEIGYIPSINCPLGRLLSR